MWQQLHEELAPAGLQVVSVALESGGPDAAAEWIERANPTYPCLVDCHHIVADRYGITNVPVAVWIDESGTIVRGPEPAGTTDAFRQMDRTDYSLPREARTELRETRQRYLEAIRDWVHRGAESRYVSRGPADSPPREHYEALVRFSLGQHLYRHGQHEEGLSFLHEAQRLAPDSWAIRRQTWALEDPAKAGGPEFWAAVDALGEGRYYPELKLE